MECCYALYFNDICFGRYKTRKFAEEMIEVYKKHKFTPIDIHKEYIVSRRYELEESKHKLDLRFQEAGL